LVNSAGAVGETVPVSTPPISARQLAGERRNEQRKLRAIRRTPAVIVGLTLVLTLGAAVAAAVDLRRLASPQGTTQAWVQAALSGDCARYGELSVLPDGRTGELSAQQCQVLQSTARSYRGSATVSVMGAVVLRSGRATADVTVVRSAAPMLAGRVELTRALGHWRIERSTFACALLACPQQ